MKTVEEFYKEISDTKALQDELKNVSEEMLGAFLKKHECEASAEEFVEFLKAQSEGAIEDEDVEGMAKEFIDFVKPHKEGEISDEDVGAVAGGGWIDN